MTYDYQQTPFSKAVFTGLFCGLAATLACLGYDLFFRLDTGFTLSSIVNVASIIFFTLSVLVAAGIIYHLLTRNLRIGKVVFIILFLLLTAFTLWKISGVERSPDIIITHQFRKLVSGIISIIGVCTFFLIPYLYGNKKFEDNVL
ncbi:hypothetical protein ACI6Q2_12790 [Chitinophagaceae bacterium LWZ2-11]